MKKVSNSQITHLLISSFHSMLDLRNTWGITSNLNLCDCVQVHKMPMNFPEIIDENKEEALPTFCDIPSSSSATCFPPPTVQPGFKLGHQIGTHKKRFEFNNVLILNLKVLFICDDLCNGLHRGILRL